MIQQNAVRTLSDDEREWLERMRKITAESGSLREGFGLPLETAVALCENATQLLEHGLDDEALVLFEGLVSLDPEEPYFRLCLACAAMKVGRTEEAASHFRRVLDARPEDVTALTYLGEILMEKKQYRAAHGLLHKAVAQDPKERDPHANRARRMLKVLEREAAGSASREG